MFTLTQTGTTTIKLSLKTSTSKQFILYKLYFTVEQPPIHGTAGLFPVKIEKKTRVVLL
jgi:hypothetical protein